MLKKWPHKKLFDFRLPLKVAASLFLLCAILSTPLAAREPIETVRPNYDIMMIAHRGTARYAPENTLPAIQKAIDAGFDYVEIDVRFTKDGVPVLLHDPKLDRTTNGSGPLSDYTLEEIKKLDAGYPEHFGDKFKDTQIPTFEEALQLMQGKINLYLDQKEIPTSEIMELVKKIWFLPG